LFAFNEICCVSKERSLVKLFSVDFKENSFSSYVWTFEQSRQSVADGNIFASVRCTRPRNSGFFDNEVMFVATRSIFN